jgi:CobQ-like glutamine amidotransferase family enzyme
MTDLQTRVAHMQTTHIQCRDFGHAWQPYTVERIPQRKRWAETLRCSRCRTHRVRFITETGALVGSTYRYVEGYRVEGVGRMDAGARAVMRLAVLQRLIHEIESEKTHG